MNFHISNKWEPAFFVINGTPARFSDLVGVTLQE